MGKSRESTVTTDDGVTWRVSRTMYYLATPNSVQFVPGSPCDVFIFLLERVDNINNNNNNNNNTNVIKEEKMKE
jgi:hypothetical protein